jgi:ABC-type transport system involved in multi-copper enzyme maturation permease subunit
MAGPLNVPLIKKELRQVLRGYVALVVSNVYLLLMAAVAVIAAAGTGLIAHSPSWEAGSGAFSAMAYVQAVLLLMLGTAVAASAVTIEHEQKTYDILMSTPLLSKQVVFGKTLSHFLVGATILLVSIPVAAAAYLLGGVPVTTAVWTYVVLLGTTALASVAGVYFSSVVQRTAAAVPLAVAAALAMLLVFSGFGASGWAFGAASPLNATIWLVQGQPVSVFGVILPVGGLSLLFWMLLGLPLMESAVQALRHPEHRRLGGVRWRFLLLVFVAALATLGSLRLRGETAATSFSPEEAQMVGNKLSGYAGGAGSLVLLLIPLFAAGLLTPLDRRRQLGRSLAKYGWWERACGLSLDGGIRYVLLLTLTALVAGELGLALWGGDLLPRWGQALALAFVPILVGMWALCWLVRLVGMGRRPATSGGRKLLAYLALVVFVVVSILPGILLGRGHKEPTGAAELASTLVVFAGVNTAFLPSATKWASPLMHSLTERIPAPLITACWYLVLGLVFWLIARRTTRRRPWLIAPPPPRPPTPSQVLLSNPGAKEP